MASDRDIQIAFINWVKEKTESKISFIDELADLLNISKDSAYRRVRGETLLTFDEISKISARYKVSLDSFLNLSTNAVVFDNRIINESFTFKEYLTSIRENLRMINTVGSKRMIWLAKDIPILHYFQSQTLTKFKLFFWQRTILNQSELQVSRYDPDLVDAEMVLLAKSVWDMYCKVPSVEIWSDETLHITMRQIEYYFDCNVIDKEIAVEIITEFEMLIKHIREETKKGRKFPLGGEDYPGNGFLHLYYNEIAIGDNTIYFEVDNIRKVFLNYNMLSTLSTTDDDFCKGTQEYLENILQKSVPLSAASEKERNRFFNAMEGKIHALQAKISKV